MKTAEMRTFEVGLVLLVHAESAEAAALTLAYCIPDDLRVERKEVQFCQEHIEHFTVN